MISIIYRLRRASLPAFFSSMALLALLSPLPLRASALYSPSAGSAETGALFDMQTMGTGAILLAFVLALGRKRMRWQSMVTAMAPEAALFDRDGRCLEISPGSRHMAKGRYLHEILPGESANRVLSAIRKTLETGKCAPFEFELNAKEWYEGNSIPDGNRALCLCRDISSRKMAEIALDAEKERLLSILQSIRNGVITTDLRGFVTYLNPEAEKLTGWQSAKASGSPLSNVFRILVEASREPAENPALAAIGDRNVNGSRKSLLLISKDGSESGIDLSAAPILDSREAIVGAAIVFHDLGDSKHLLWQAGHDALTGLLNRVLLHDRLIHSMAGVKRQGKMLAVLFIDLDGFKSVNDRLGHTMGDMLLKEVALRLKKAVRAEDTTARIGGDEFVVLQEASDRNEVKSCLERIMGTINAPFLLDGTSVSVSPSIGVVLYPENDAEPETLLRQADMAMYHAKQSGRNRYHFFDSRMDFTARKTRERQTKIESALKNGELLLHYQPKINLKSGKIMGLEALIRWQDPDLDTLVLPADFLPTVQDTQLIVEIGSWVIRNALEQMRAWQDLGIALDVSVNIASRQLHDPDFVGLLKEEFEAFPDVEPERLELEILETTAIADFRLVQQVLSSCRDIGVRLSLDDFGTGYSSLSYLKNLPVDRLKIDRSFVGDMLDNRDNLAIIRSIVSLSRIFDREVIAEGMESSSQGKMLIRLGCKLAQGYGIAEPMPSSSIPEWIGSWPQNPGWMKHQSDFTSRENLATSSFAQSFP